MRNLIILGWASMAASLLAMVFGHLGTQKLDWVSDQISTYAAVAPHAGFITTAIILSAVTLLILGVLVSKYRILGTTHFAHIAAMFTGAAAAGLITLAHFKETARNLVELKQAGFWAIRVQSFHDAGLMIFFYSSLAWLMLAGLLIISHYNRVVDKIQGGIILISGPVSYLLMRTKWPHLFGITGVTTGLNERAAFFILWLAAALLFFIASRVARRTT
jgi:multisubunit Na+/H+ antiporter MnhC subunit